VILTISLTFGDGNPPKSFDFFLKFFDFWENFACKQKVFPCPSSWSFHSAQGRAKGFGA
jgi:hypothetical protein